MRRLQKEEKHRDGSGIDLKSDCSFVYGQP